MLIFSVGQHVKIHEGRSLASFVFATRMWFGTVSGALVGLRKGLLKFRGQCHPFALCLVMVEVRRFLSEFLNKIHYHISITSLSSSDVSPSTVFFEVPVKLSRTLGHFEPSGKCIHPNLPCFSSTPSSTL